MKSHKINKLFERYAAFLLKWRWATLRISKALLNNSLTLSTFAYADVRDGGIFNRLSADWAATDQIHAILGYDFFYAEKGMFARYAHNSEVWVKLKYCF